jgi:hypothetical protein
MMSGCWHYPFTSLFFDALYFGVAALEAITSRIGRMNIINIRRRSSSARLMKKDGLLLAGEVGGGRREASPADAKGKVDQRKQ